MSIGSYIYFTTFRPDASIARLHSISSFCQRFCGAIAYCNNNKCECQTPFVKFELPDGTIRCLNPTEQKIIDKEVANEAAAITFGVFWVFALVAALAGWYMWWKGKAASYQALG